MNRYRMDAPKPDIVLPGEQIYFMDGSVETLGKVVTYSDGKYCISVPGPIMGDLAPSFHYNVMNVRRA